MTPYYEDDSVTLYLGDCRDVDTWADADVLITDPPYGIAYDGQRSKQVNPITHDPIAGDAEPFDPAHLLRFNRAVIWGGNNFASRLPDAGGWVVWDKTLRNDIGMRIADAELAWTNCLTRTRVVRHLWSGAFRASERGTAWHPAQKPIVVLAWVVRLVSKPGELIADPYAGAGSTLLAAKYEGRRAVGVEVDERYAERAAHRLAQDTLFGAV